MAQKEFRVNVQSAGYIRQTQDGYGFEIDDKPDGWSKPNVFLSNGTVYISTELFTTLGGSTLFLQPNAKIGRTRLFDIEDPYIADTILDHSTYGCRSEREQEVRQRNQAIIEWLISLL